MADMGRTTAPSIHGDIDTRDAFEMTPLMTAAKNGDLDSVRQLIGRGANPLAVDFEGFNSLHTAAKGGRRDVVQYLIDLGVPVEIKSHRGYTPLNIAVVRAPIDIIAGTIMPLLAAGAEINTRAKHANTPLIAAAVRNASGAVGYLVSRSADLNSQDASGMTALMLVTKVSRYPSMVEQLLLLGADPAIRDHTGRSAGDIASENARSGKDAATAILMALTAKLYRSHY